MKRLLSISAHTFGIAAILVVAADPALASVPVPGPLIGVGAPALALFAAGYYVIRKYRVH
jgi:hypothetical protein